MSSIVDELIYIAEQLFSSFLPYKQVFQRQLYRHAALPFVISGKRVYIIIAGKDQEVILCSEKMEQFAFALSLYHHALLEKTLPTLTFTNHLHEVKQHRQTVLRKFLELLKLDLTARSTGIQWQSIDKKRCPWGRLKK